MSVGVGVLLLLFIFLTGAFRESSEVREPSAPAEIRRALAPRFQEVSRAMGVDHVSATLFPAVAVADINGDGYQDILIAEGRGRPNRLYLNAKGEGFREAAARYGIQDVARSSMSMIPLIADFNADGLPDLLLAGGCHRLLLGRGSSRPFIDVSGGLGGYCSNARSANVLDFDRDGVLDIVIGNTSMGDVSARQSTSYSRNEKATVGDRWALFHGKGDGTFQRVETGFTERPRTNAIGISDVDDDGWPDIFFANDQSTDELLLNDKGRGFRRASAALLPRLSDGQSGMSAEFADFDGDGRQDLYVTNVYKPPFRRSFNLLWRRTDSGFSQTSIEMGVARCGWAWAAKSGDFNNDGRLDLFVGNGHFGSTLRPETARSGWYRQYTVAHALPFLRALIPDWELSPPGPSYRSAYEESCLFMRGNGQFHEMGAEAGISDLGDAKGVAVLDIDNDGNLDLVVVNSYGRTLLYRNASAAPRAWIGLALQARSGGSIPVGARIRLKRTAEPDLVRDLYPSNGFLAQNDGRIHFGLGYWREPVDADVDWPSGRRERFAGLALNRYVRIREGAGARR